LAEASVEVVVSEAAVFTGEAAVAGNSFRYQKRD
jgi:hypothetical protein